MTSVEEQLRAAIRTIADVPKPGIQFRDITTLLGDARAFAMTIEELRRKVLAYEVQAIAGLEARGFIFGAALAAKMGLAFVPVRKPGKLPGPTFSQDYELEYGSDILEVHQDAFEAGTKVALIDDLIATGGTACAATELCRRAGARVVAAFFVVELPELGGKEALEALDLPVHSLVRFDGH